MQSFYQAETPVRCGGEGDVEPGHLPPHLASHPCHGLLSENIFVCFIAFVFIIYRLAVISTL